MANAKSWLKAMRLRTLPLSLATILTGNFLAIATGENIPSVFVLSVLTTVFLQVLSNLANDLGDHLKGTDNDQRVGPARATQSGEISVKEMKAGILIFIILSLISGISLLFVSNLSAEIFTIFFGLGIASILAAIFYTMGKRPYGYRAMGDIFVFLFFGLVGVHGSFYLNTGRFAEIELLAFSIGFFSTAVLNMNNMRDHVNDKANHKNTLVVMLGFKNAKIYHSLLLLFGCILPVIFISQNFDSVKNYLFLLVYPVYVLNLIKVWKTSEPRELDPELKKLAIATFLFSLLFGMSIIEF